MQSGIRVGCGVNCSKSLRTSKLKVCSPAVIVKLEESQRGDEHGYSKNREFRERR